MTTALETLGSWVISGGRSIRRRGRRFGRYMTRDERMENDIADLKREMHKMKNRKHNGKK